MIRIKRDADGQKILREVRTILSPYFAQITLQIQKDVDFHDVLSISGDAGGGNGAFGTAEYRDATKSQFTGTLGLPCADCVNGKHERWSSFHLARTLTGPAKGRLESNGMKRRGSARKMYREEQATMGVEGNALVLQV